MRAYGLGILYAEERDAPMALAYADSLESLSLPADQEHLSHDLALGVRARVAMSEAQVAQALQHLRAMRLSAWHGQSLFSPLCARTAERFLRAESLMASGDGSKALAWFRVIAQNSPFEVAFIPAALLNRAEIHEAREETHEAIRLYEAFLEMWAEAEPVHQEVVGRARERLRQLRGG